jgi:hypothetical protein
MMTQTERHSYRIAQESSTRAYQEKIEAVRAMDEAVAARAAAEAAMVSMALDTAANVAENLRLAQSVAALERSIGIAFRRDEVQP